MVAADKLEGLEEDMMKRKWKRVRQDPAVATIKMVIMVVMGWAVLALLTKFWPGPW
ncbi:hypothetical protein ES708_35254 [subsurface metagenome]